MTPEPNPSEINKKPGPSNLWVWVAVIWLAGFSAYFFTRPMPNLQSNRWTVWQAVPTVVFDWILPAPKPLEEKGMRSGWEYLPERLMLWSWAALILGGAWGIGSWIIRWLVNRGDLTALERFVFSAGLGLSALSLLTLITGVFGFLHRGLFIGLLMMSPVSAFACHIWNRNDALSLSEPSRTNSKWPWLLVFAMLPFLIVMLLGGVSPSTDFDVKEYHFGGPKEFFLAGRVQFLEHNVYTSFPFLTEMLTLLGMVLKGDWALGALVGKSVLMAFVPLTGLAILAAGRRWFSAAAGWLGMLIWLTTPWAARIAMIAYAEGGLACYLFLAFFATSIAIEECLAGRVKPGLFGIAGLLAGSAMACKYTGLVSVILPLGLAIGFAAFRWKKTPVSEGTLKRDRLRAVAAFALGVTITIGPWLIKNLVETGNPVYPLAWSVFGGRDWDADLNARWKKAHSPPHHKLSSWLIWDNGAPGWLIDLSVINDWLSPLLYAFAPLVFLWPAVRRRAGWIWLYVGWLFFSWWAFTHRLDRFWVPMLPVVSLLAGAGAVWHANRIWRIAAGAIIALTLIFNFVIIGTGNAGYIAWLTRLEDAQKRTARLTAAEIDYLNRQFALSHERAKVLSVGDAEVFDARFPILYNTVFDRSLLEEYMTAADGSLLEPETIRERFRQADITHIYVNWQEVLRYRPTYGYADFVKPDRFDWLVQNGVLEPRVVLNHREWAELSESERNELETSGWRESLRDDHPAESIVLSAVYRVRD